MKIITIISLIIIIIFIIIFIIIIIIIIISLLLKTKLIKIENKNFFKKKMDEDCPIVSFH